MMSMLWAALRVCPCAAAVMLMVMFWWLGSVLNLCLSVSVCWGFCPPMILSPPVSFAMVCTMLRWWAAMTILCPCSLALWTHSIACCSLACAVILRSAVSCMSVSLFCAAKCARIRAAVGLVPSLIASCSHWFWYHSCRSFRAWLYSFLCLLSSVACMVLYVIGGRSGRTSSFSLRM